VIVLPNCRDGGINDIVRMKLFPLILIATLGVAAGTPIVLDETNILSRRQGPDSNHDSDYLNTPQHRNKTPTKPILKQRSPAH
jgi:hypothetical protein